MKKFLKYALLTFLVIVIVGFVFFIVWALTPAGPSPEALDALQSNTNVLVTHEPWIVFEPTKESPATGIIFYPGGRIDPRSYAPLAHSLAENGHLAVIVPMPLNLAVFNPNAAKEIIDAFPEIDHWVIAGHSLGGAMAANFVDNNPSTVAGLVLLAAYPAANNDLSEQEIKVVSIFGTNDGLADVKSIQDSQPLLPVHTHWVEIPGGNHAQFGWYGSQAGDNPATIGHVEQQEMVLQAILDLINQVQNQ